MSAEIDVAKNVASKTEPDLNILLTQASPLRWPFVYVENGALERFRIYCGEGVVGHLGWGRVIAHRDLSGNLLLACELLRIAMDVHLVVLLELRSRDLDSLWLWACLAVVEC